MFSEREFAEKFNTTRPAVREAFTALEALRVVERRPQAGIYLRDLSEDGLKDRELTRDELRGILTQLFTWDAVLSVLEEEPTSEQASERLVGFLYICLSRIVMRDFGYYPLLRVWIEAFEEFWDETGQETWARLQQEGQS